MLFQSLCCGVLLHCKGYNKKMLIPFDVYQNICNSVWNFLVNPGSRTLISNLYLLLFIFYLQIVVSVFSQHKMQFLRHMENFVVALPGSGLQFPLRAAQQSPQLIRCSTSCSGSIVSGISECFPLLRVNGDEGMVSWIPSG